MDESASTMLMPSLLLQPLIENAIKYSVSPREQWRLDSHRRACHRRHVAARGVDDGPGLVDVSRVANGRGVGLRNTRERLQVVYGDRGVVQIANAEPGLRVALTLPAESGVART